jgi:hypothetical protein
MPVQALLFDLRALQHTLAGERPRDEAQGRLGPKPQWNSKETT